MRSRPAAEAAGGRGDPRWARGAARGVADPRAGGRPRRRPGPPNGTPLRAAMAPAVLRRQLSEPSAAQIAAGVRVRNPLFGP